MTYIKLIVGVPTKYSFSQLRMDNPQISFPATLSPALLTQYGLFEYSVDTPVPEFNPATEYVVETSAQLDGTVYRKAWQVVAYTSTELAQMAAEREQSPENILALLKALGVMTTKSLVIASTLTKPQADAIAALYPEWKVGEVVVVGDTVRRFAGELYTPVQGHTTQANWTPPQVPALWKKVAAPATIPAWVQPAGSQDAYAMGAQVTHDNPNQAGAIWIYESELAANTTQPGRDGTFDRWWTPVSRA